MLEPPITPPERAGELLRAQGYAVVDAARLLPLNELGHYWEGLPPDPHLRDGGHYRKRRHSCFVIEGDAVRQVPHRAHWQPVEYNALHGGFERWFEPIDPSMIERPIFPRLLSTIGEWASLLRGPQPWYVEAHAFRIDTEGGIGRPTPEGAHRDGVDLVAVILAGRKNVKGGETRVFEAAGPRGIRFTLVEPWTMMLLDDARVIHETTPIQPLDPGAPAHRDTLVVTYRAGAFQGP